MHGARHHGYELAARGRRKSGRDTAGPTRVPLHHHARNAIREMNLARRDVPQSGATISGEAKFRISRQSVVE